MFEYSMGHWAAFFVAALLLNLSPGPDMLFILSQTIRRGRRAGFRAMAGIWTGACFHILLAALGLSAVLATSALAFSIVKFLGAGYLIWLGVQAWRGAGVDGLSPGWQAPANRSDRSIYLQGIFVAASNPKVSLFFLAFLPQFVVPGAGPIGAQLFLHGVLIIAVAGVVEPPLVLLGARLSRLLKNHSSISKWIERVFGSILISLGVSLALEK